jgi:hypothetical protein
MMALAFPAVVNNLSHVERVIVENILVGTMKVVLLGSKWEKKKVTE